MKNPFLKNFYHLRLYLLTWLVIGFAHAGILYVYYHLPFSISVTDSLVYNFIYAGMGLNFWYAVRYLNIEKQKPLVVLIAHIISAKIFLLVWLISGNFLMNVIYGENILYNNFVFSTILGRSISGLFYYFITVLIYYLIVYYFFFKEKLIREASLRALVKESELSLLRSQLNPHFIFNSLNSISALTISNPEKAQNMIVKLSSYLRYALEHNGNKLITLSKELENSLLYLEIEKVRFGDKLFFKKDLSEEVLSCLLPNMTIQPLLENAIKHGVYESREPITIILSGNIKNNILTLKISNNFDNDGALENRKGIGLRNVRERLQLIYGKKELIKTCVKESIFEVQLFIPQKHE